MRNLFFLLLFACISAPALADSVCGDEEHWDDCLIRVQTEAISAQPKQAQAVRNAATSASVERTQASQLATNGNESGTLRDLLPRVFTILGIDGLDSSNGRLKYTYNPEPTSFGQFSFTAEARQPELFERLKMAIPEAMRTEVSGKLEDELGDFDDNELTLSFSAFRTTGEVWWGRRYFEADGAETALTQLADRLFADASARTLGQTSANSAQFEIVGRRLQDLRESWEERQEDDAGLPDWHDSTVSDTDPVTRAAIEASIEKLGETYLAEVRAMDKELADSHFFRFADLAARQPQLLVSAKRQIRDDLAGADEWSISLRGEGSWANLNAFRAECLDPASDTLTLKDTSRYDDLLNCFASYVTNNEASMDEGWRWSLEAEYGRTDAYDFERPDLGIEPLHIDEVESWTAKAALGRSLRLDDKGLEVSRFDLEATYDDVSGDPEKQSRFLLTGTLTQRLGDDMSLETSVVYANKPEYRGEVDEEFSARAGFKYKIKRKNE